MRLATAGKVASSPASGRPSETGGSGAGPRSAHADGECPSELLTGAPRGSTLLRSDGLRPGTSG